MAEVIALPDPGLGNTSYLVDLGDGSALAVDPSRDLRDLRVAAEARGLRVRLVAETHLHADFLSGAVQLAADGAVVLASASGARAFPHTGLTESDEIDLGGLTLRALATPGHTEEHLAYLLLDGPRELGVFSGGSLLNGSAARVDLVDPERTEELARAQYHSVRRLAALSPDAALWPTHGGGSFCATAAGPGTPTTIGDQVAANPLLAARDETAFVAHLLATMGSYPPYFLTLPERNRRGPDLLLGPSSLAALGLDAVRTALQQGAVLVDVRSVEAFAAGHPAGAISIPLRPAFATWLGWLLTADRPWVLLRDPDQDHTEVLGQALKIGQDGLLGELAGGFASWHEAGLPVSTVELVSPDEVTGDAWLDIRQSSEYAAGHLPGAHHVELGELAEDTAVVASGLAGPAQSPVVMCGHGERAMTAASLLGAAGASGLRVLTGSAAEVAAARRIGLEAGP